MNEFWDSLSRKTFVGSGYLTCKNATEWPCEIRLYQLFNGSLVVRIFNVQKKPPGMNSEWLSQCAPFGLIGTLNDGRGMTVQKIHPTRSGVWTIEGFVHRPGFVEIANPDGTGMSFQRVTCEVTNLSLGRSVGPIEANVGKAQVWLDWLPHHNDNRRLMEALKTAGSLSSISIKLLEQTSEDQLDDLVNALCNLLTLAQRSSVSCVARHWQDANGTIARSRYQESVFAYPTMFAPLIPAEFLSTFVQSTLENYDRQWKTWDLDHAIDYYVQAMSLRSVWSQAVGFFTALETLKNAFLRQPGNAELGRLVPKGGFKKEDIINQVIGLLDERLEIFKDLSEKDGQALEDSLRNKIGSLNQRAYKLVLRDMFRKLGVPFNDEELKWLVKLRNQIIHGGSPDYEKAPWNNFSEASAWAAKFAGLVERTILAILDYRGNFV